MTWWKPARLARWFALIATLLVAACSEPTSEGTRGPNVQPPSPTGSPVTTLQGEIVGDFEHPGYTVEVPDGWSTEDGGFIIKEGPAALGVSVWDVGEVPRDPCQWKGTVTRPGPTVEALVEALTSQRLRDPTRPADVTLAGYEGRYLEWSVPEDLIVTGDSHFPDCDDRNFTSWWGTYAGNRYQQVPGQVDRLWVLDVEGQTLVVDATYSPDTSAADRRELEQIVTSLQFAQP